MPSRPRTRLLSLVVPVFDEAESLPALHGRLAQVLDAIDIDAEIIVVDDGSRDATPLILAEIADADERVVDVRLSRNFGHQAAVSAGLDHARGDAVIVIDGDLQDPPELIPRMLDLWREGHDVVYAVRRTRQESLALRWAYGLFYRLLRAVSDLDIPLDSGDFCLMDRKVISALQHMPERARFLRGLRTFVGFRQIGLEYDRPARARGRSKYTLRKLLGLAIDGIVSFSAAPLRIVTHLGIATALTAFLLAAWVLLDALITQTAPRGWASTLLVVLFLGSVQLIGLGIIGEYLRLIFVETKRRPTYVLAESPIRDARRGRRRPRWFAHARQRRIKSPLGIRKRIRTMKNSALVTMSAKLS